MRFYKIIPTESYSTEVVEDYESCSFLYDNLAEKIQFFKSKIQANVRYITFFGNITFTIIEDETKELVKEQKVRGLKSLKDWPSYYCCYMEDNITDLEISKILRNSSTLKIDEVNHYDSLDIRVVVAETGFMLVNKRTDWSGGEDKFKRSLLMFMLIIAYNIRNQNLIVEISRSFEAKNHIQALALRDEIHAFNLSGYYFNPVKQNNHQAYTIWSIMSRIYEVEARHLEMKSQISELCEIIESRHRDQMEDKKNRWERRISRLAIFIALISLITVFKDLKDLLHF